MQFNLHNSVQLVADERKNTFIEEDEKLSNGDSSGIATLDKEKCFDDGKTGQEAPLGGVVTASSPNANKTKNSVMNLDDQLLGKPKIPHSLM